MDSDLSPLARVAAVVDLRLAGNGTGTAAPLGPEAFDEVDRLLREPVDPATDLEVLRVAGLFFLCEATAALAGAPAGTAGPGPGSVSLTADSVAIVAAALLRPVAARQPGSLPSQARAWLADVLPPDDGGDPDLAVAGDAAYLYALAYETGDLTLIGIAIRLLRHCRPRLDPDGIATDLALLFANALLARGTWTGSVEDLAEALELVERRLAVGARERAGKAELLVIAASCRVHRHQIAGQLADLDVAVDAGRSAVELAPGADGVQAQSVTGSAMFARYQRTGNAADLDGAVGYLEQAVVNLPDSDFRTPGYLSDLSLAYSVRYEHRGQVADLRRAADHGWRSVRSCPADYPTRGVCLLNFGLAVGLRHRRFDDPDDLDLEIEIFEHALSAIRPEHPCHITCLSNLGGALRSRGVAAGSKEDLDRAINLLAEAVAQAPPMFPHRLHCVSNLGNALHSRWSLTGDVADVDRAVSHCREAAALAAAPHPDQGQHLLNLAALLTTRAKYSGDAAALDEAVDTFRRAVEATAAMHAERHRSKLGLAAALRLRFGRSGDPHDLTEAVDLLVDTSQVMPAGHPGLAQVLSVLGDAYLARYDHLGMGSDLATAVATSRRALAAAVGESSQVARLDDLLGALLASAQRTGRPEDLSGAAEIARQRTDHSDLADRLEEASGAVASRETKPASSGDLDDEVAAWRARLAALAADSPLRADSLMGLASALSKRYTRTGVRADLDEAALLARQRVVETSGDGVDAARGLSHLAAVLSLRAEHAGTLDDAVEAADLARRAVAVAAPGSPVGLVALCTLSNALNVLAESSAVPVDHADVVELMREALERLPAGREHRQALLGQLADSLFLRARSSGSLPELGEAVTFARQAVRATDADDPFLTGRLSALGRSLDLQFAWTGDLNDADAGLDAGKAAVATLPSDHPELPKLLTNVAVGLAARFGRSQNPVDLDDAAEAARRAVDATSADHANLGVRLTALANALDARFTLLGLPHSDEALDLRRRAVASVTADHPAYAMYLSNLGASLVEQGIVTGDKSTLREAVDVVRRAVDATPDGHPSQASRLYNLAMAHAAASRVSLVRGGYRKIMWQAVRVPTTPVMTRISLARRAGDHLVMLRLWREAAEALTYALDLAGQLVTRDLSRTAQQSRMEALDGLAADAVACWLRAGHERRAVAAFEQGRAVLASQVLDARTDLTDLAASHPRLAQRFEQLRNELDAVDATEAHKSPMTAAASPNLPEAMWATERAEANRRRQAATEFDVLLDEVRAMPGFERFMLRPNVDELLAAASAGPVVLINVSTHRSDALILTGNSVYVARLRGLTPESVRERVAEFRTALRATETDDDPGVAVEHGAEARIRGVLHWLWESIVRPVRRWLRWTTPPPQSGRLPRIWWCPSGPLSFLPLHAAGYHDLAGQSSPNTVLDRMVSSYTPSVRALVHARSLTATATSAGVPRKGPTPEAARHLLVVAMPQTPYADDLPSVRREVQVLRRTFPGAVTVLDQPPPTRQAVLDALPLHDWVHFACHAYSDPDDPSASRLLLHDHLRGPLTVADVARLRLTTPGLAFLSACSGGQPGERLPDEAIHLASAFQLAGYRHVIAALWQLDDDLAVEVTARVYEMLARTGMPSADDAAQALHDVVVRLRDARPDAPSTWSTYIHVGV